LTIGPAFLSAAVYLCLARIVVVYGEGLSRFSPRFYTLTFITFDFIALLLQAAGGAIASGATTASSDKMGINIMVAGVAWQVASLGIFAILCAEYGWRVYRSSESQRNPNFALFRNTFRFKAFLWTLGLATLAIFVRSVYRCVELRAGFHSKLANQQITFMILDGAMIASACILLTVFHPGLSFQGRWHDASWSLGKKDKNGGLEAVHKSSGDNK
jgi:RTA1 like protein